MKYVNHIPLLVALGIVSFLFFILLAAHGVWVVFRMEHSWGRLRLYAYLLSTALALSPLCVVWFSRRAAFILLSVALHLFTISCPIMMLDVDHFAWPTFGVSLWVSALGASSILVLHNQKVVDEAFGASRSGRPD